MQCVDPTSWTQEYTQRADPASWNQIVYQPYLSEGERQRDRDQE